jgi:hypothetical protein
MSTARTTKTWNCLTLAFGAMLAISIFLRPSARSRGPTLLDVKRIAEAQGLYSYARNDRNLANEAADYQKIIISRRILSEEEVEGIALIKTDGPSWRDCVCVMRLRPGGDQRHLVPIPDDIVGNLLFFGDAKMISAIKTDLASGQR